MSLLKVFKPFNILILNSPSFLMFLTHEYQILLFLLYSAASLYLPDPGVESSYIKYRVVTLGVPSIFLFYTFMPFIKKNVSKISSFSQNKFIEDVIHEKTSPLKVSSIMKLKMTSSLIWGVTSCRLRTCF